MRMLLLTILLAGVPLTAAQAEPVEPPGNLDTPRAKGPLSAQESKFQGVWQAYDFKSNEKLYKMKFEGRDFRADTRDQWYEGYIAIRTDTEPARLDFVIEKCECGFKGQTSTGIFYWDGKTIMVSAPAPGDDRPREFDKSSGSMFRLKPEGRD